jgi:hypothetical protein
MNKFTVVYGYEDIPSYINYYCNKEKLTRKQFRLLVLCASVNTYSRCKTWLMLLKKLKAVFA